MKRASFCIAAFVFAAPAQAGESAWHETTGARLRLVTETQATPDGTLRGALEIRLEDGWKTYWKEPGEGVAPQISLADANAADGVMLDFPAPRRFDDGTLQWAGYEGSVVFPVVVTGLADADASLGVDLFLGVCETICVPVQTMLELRPSGDLGPIEQAGIDAAFANLPGKPEAGFQAKAARIDADTLSIDVEFPDGGRPADIFLVGHDGLLLAAPEFVSAPGGGTFTVRIVAPGKGAPAIDYTLAAGDEAVTGALPLP